MPFGPNNEYADMAACIAANSGKDDPAAYCAAIMRATEKRPALRRKPLPAEVVGVGEYEFMAVVTTGMVDRQGEVLVPDGMDSTAFDRSGAILWNHDSDRPIAVPGKIARDKNRVTATATFLRRPADYVGDWFPDFARAFVAQTRELGRSVGVSIGFLPARGGERRPNAKDVKTYGTEVRSIISRWKLLEWSLAPVQSNEEAMTLAVRSGRLSAPCVKALFGLEVKAGPAPARKVILFLGAPRTPVARTVPAGLLKKSVVDALDKRAGRIYSRFS